MSEEMCRDCEREFPEKYIDRGLCPKCREKERIKGEERHQATRDPTREPY